MIGYDPETGLPGRVLLVDRLGVATARSERTGGAVALLLLDAPPGELRLRAERLHDAIRAGDSVGLADEAQLAVVLDDLGAVGEAEAIGARALALMGGEDVAIGFAVAEGERRDAGEMFEEAAAALERAREAGGGCRAFDAALHDRAAARARAEAELRHAIASGELRLHYQPIVDIEDGSMRGIEALVRWEHPEDGLLAPDAFVPGAEESGAIVPLGGWVLRDACRQVATWHATRDGEEAFRPFWLAVNVSARQLAHPALASMVQVALAESGLAPDLLLLEIAEGDLAAGSAPAAEALRRLHAMGVRITIADATTEWRARAGDLPVDVLKVPTERVEGVLAGLHGEVEVIAERIEEREQEVALRRSGGQLAQGFLYARPAPAEEVEALLDVAPPAPVVADDAPAPPAPGGAPAPDAAPHDATRAAA
jgi:EAL domain-containing protein (putative c-di-GMP-specific phosphodiesterase class I)/GGDEF domain-containing protein